MNIVMLKDYGKYKKGQLYIVRPRLGWRLIGQGYAKAHKMMSQNDWLVKRG